MLKPVDLSRLWSLRDTDPDARARLIDAHRGLVIVTRSRTVPRVPPAIESDDLDSEGFIALVKAVDAYDPARGVKFNTYAITIIRGAILEYLRREDPLTRDLRRAQKAMDAATDVLAADGRPISIQTIAAQLGVGERLVAAWRSAIAAREILPMAQPTVAHKDEGWGELTIADHIPDHAPTPEEQVVARLEFVRLLRQAEAVMRLLRDRERITIRETVGNLKTEREVAPLVGVSHWRVHQIKAAALTKARALAASMSEENDYAASE